MRNTVWILAMAWLLAACAPQPAPTQGWRAFGNEPFWNVVVSGDTLLYTTPEDLDGQTLTGTRHARADGIELAGMHAGRPFVLRVRAGACNDGMSDNAYGHTAMFQIEGRRLAGCAQPVR